MASNNSVSSNDALHANVRVKIEPGTSVSPGPSTSSVPFLDRVNSIKMEPGLPTTTKRLTSYRLPRDLTLGANIKTEKPKKVYTPNLNVQRNKKKDDPAISVKTDQARSRNSDRGRERGRGDRGRGRGGNKGNIIQTVGVWSEGINTFTAPRKSNGPRAPSSTESSGKRLEKPKLGKSRIINKTEEERKLLNLSMDDFIEDDLDGDEKMCPLTLPRVKKDRYSTIDNDKIDNKPVISENGEIINVEKREESKQDRKEQLTISQIIENKANSYTLIQFPGSLPGLKSSREDAGSKPNDANTHSESDSKEKTEQCTLNSLRGGPLGKLEILKSGKARLRIGEMSFFVDIGAQQRFQQDLLAVKIDAASQTGDLVNLGPVNNKLICSPDFESLLENS